MALPNEPMHNHSRVYFMIHENGMVEQRSVATLSASPTPLLTPRYCSCHSERIYNGVVCNKFKSRQRYLPNSIRQLLWPSQQQQRPEDLAIQDLAIAECKRETLLRRLSLRVEQFAHKVDVAAEAADNEGSDEEQR